MATLDEMLAMPAEDKWAEIMAHCGEEHDLRLDLFTEGGDLTEDPDEATHAALLCIAHDEGAYLLPLVPPDAGRAS